MHPDKGDQRGCLLTNGQLGLRSHVPLLQDGVKAVVAIGQDLTELCELKAVEEPRGRFSQICIVQSENHLRDCEPAKM